MVSTWNRFVVITFHTVNWYANVYVRFFKQFENSEEEKIVQR